VSSGDLATINAVWLIMVATFGLLATEDVV
jgi:hypothetical protein